MEHKQAIKIKVQASIAAPIQQVWDKWTLPEHITQWNQASEDWHTPRATNDLRTGGSFSSRMEAKDGSFGFDFGGVYTDVQVHARIAYVMEDGRAVSVDFQEVGGETLITEVFDAETVHAPEMQQAGWQSILDNFKKYAEKA
jgi:uncharacterized protein YndB with AHSA1/START domain